MAIEGRQQPGQASIPLFALDPTAAAAWYENVLGAEPVRRGLLGDGSLVYIELKVGGLFLHVVRWHEPPPGSQDEHWPAPATALRGTSFMVWLYVDDVDATIGRALAAGATQHPRALVQDTFSGDRVGQFRDPFGYLWRVSTTKEQVAQDIADARLAELRAAHRVKHEEARPS